MRLSREVAFCLFAVLPASGQAMAPSAVYKDPRAPVEKRVDDLLRRMTLEEKIAQMGIRSSTAFIVDGRFDESKMAPMAVMTMAVYRP